MTKTAAKEVDLRKLWEKVLAGNKIKDERVFLTDPKFAYLYAKYIRKKRWDEKDEVVFHQDLRSAYLYSVFVGEGKIPEHIHNYFIAKKIGGLSDCEQRWSDEYFKFIELQSKNKNK